MHPPSPAALQTHPLDLFAGNSTDFPPEFTAAAAAFESTKKRIAAALGVEEASLSWQLDDKYSPDCEESMESCSDMPTSWPSYPPDNSTNAPSMNNTLSDFMSSTDILRVESTFGTQPSPTAATSSNTPAAKDSAGGCVKGGRAAEVGALPQYGVLTVSAPNPQLLVRRLLASNITMLGAEDVSWPLIDSLSKGDAFLKRLSSCTQPDSDCYDLAMCAPCHCNLMARLADARTAMQSGRQK